MISLRYLVLAAVCEVTGLGVDPLTLLVAPSIDEVAKSKGNTHVWELHNSTAEAVEEVALEDTSEGVLLEWRDGRLESIHTVGLDTLLSRAAKCTPPADPLVAGGHAAVNNSAGTHGGCKCA